MGFAIKVPMFPFHTWLPDAHTEAPTVGSVILAAVLLKLGVYGFIRIAIPILPEAAQAWAPWIGGLAVIGIIYGALGCLAQKDMKRLIAFSSVAHMGFVMLGVATLTSFGINAAVFGMVAHGLITGMLFFIAGSIQERFGTREIARLGGLLTQAPQLGWILGFCAFASLGLPGLAGFWGEFPAILAAYQPAEGLSVGLFRAYMAIAAIGTVFAAGYLLWMFQRVAFGTAKDEFERLPHPRRPRAGVDRVDAAARRHPRLRDLPPPHLRRHRLGREPHRQRRRRRRPGRGRGGPSVMLLAVAQAAQTGFTAPHLDYHALAPEIVLSVVLAAVLLADLVLDETKKWVIPSIASFGLLATFVPIITLALYGDDVRSMVGGAYVVDNFALVLKALFIGVGYVVLLLSNTYVEEGDYYEGEYYFLLLASLMGMVVMASSRDLITIFVALETLSIPAYILAGWRKRDLKSNEASLKYYLLGVLASAVMLYGMSLIYGYTGTTILTDIGAQLQGNAADNPLVTFAILFVIIGFAFKVSAVPFHSWAPDTYEGAPTPVTAFLSVASKTGGFVALFQLVFIGFLGRDDVWGPLFGVLAVLTMTVGNLIALRQTNVVRLLAYSSIAQAGYILVPLAVAGTSPDAAQQRPHRVDRLPARLRGHEPGRLRHRAGRGPQDPVGRDLVVRRAVRVRPRAGRAHDDLPVLAGRHPAAGRGVGQDLHVPGRARRRHRLGRRPRRGGRRQLGDRPLLLRRHRPPDVDEPGARRRPHADQGADAAGDRPRDHGRGRGRGRRLPAAVRALRRPGIADEVGARAVAAEGLLRFDEVVELALYGPDGGFYAGGRGAGRGGADFITSPEVGPLFGTVLAGAVVSWWEELGRPDPFTVVEAGAGRGTLAASILGAGAAGGDPLRGGGALGRVAGGGGRAAGRPGRGGGRPAGRRRSTGWCWPTSCSTTSRSASSSGRPRGGRRCSSTRTWPRCWSRPPSTGLPDAAVGARIPVQDRARDWVAAAVGSLRRGRVVVVRLRRHHRLHGVPAVDGLGPHLPGPRPGRPSPRRPGLGRHHLRGGRRPAPAGRRRDRSQAEFLRAHGLDDLVAAARRRVDRAGPHRRPPGAQGPQPGDGGGRPHRPVRAGRVPGPRMGGAG